MNETWPGMANANSCVYVPNCLKGNWPELHRETGGEGREGERAEYRDPIRLSAGLSALSAVGEENE